MKESTATEVQPLLARLEEALKARLDESGLSAQKIRMVGIHTGGVWVAETLHRRLEVQTAMGALNINFYRDDFTQIGMHPRVTPSNLPFEVEGEHIVLVDDVLHTGRTIRAALNEIFDYGRPASVTLGVLVERNGREIPIQADAIGKSLILGAEEYVKLSGPEPLTLQFRHRDGS